MDIDINIEIPIDDLERLIDKMTASAVTIISVATAAYVVRSIFVSPR